MAHIVNRLATYEVHVFCDQCSQLHPMNTAITLDDGPIDDMGSIGDTYAGRELPSEVATAMKNRFSCPATGRWCLQRNKFCVFLVPALSE